ncbi:SDR family oxidoreductase [Mycobacterium sp. 1165178.9]|uniref:SDR family oxidoreductase n=1 Tax=Mycobacterium sp. 1165178.9 TaxID=1834070 RepID=UPI000ADDDAAC
MGTVDDLEHTTKAIESLGRKVVARKADVRDMSALQRVVSEATQGLGPISIVIANAGIFAPGTKEPSAETVFRNVLDVNLIGVWNTVMAAAPSMRETGNGGAIVLTSSTAGLRGAGSDGTCRGQRLCRGQTCVVGLMRSFAHWLAKDNIRVNTVHPTGVETPVIINETVSAYLANNPEITQATVNLLEVPFVQTADISDAVVWLVSDYAKYVTDVALPVDAGSCAR